MISSRQKLAGAKVATGICRVPQSVVLMDKLVLPNPVGIASSHLTGDKRSLSKCLARTPGFLTIKTISDRQGGLGSGKRFLRRIKSHPVSASFASDGPRYVELLTTDAAVNLILHCLSHNSETVIGASIACGENYLEIVPQLERSGAQFIELNLKYVAKEAAIVFEDDPVRFVAMTIDHVLLNTDMLLATTKLPVFVKFARNMEWAVSASVIRRFENLNGSTRLAFIAANSEPQVPLMPFFGKSAPRYGALTGAHLFPHTLSFVHRLAHKTALPVIASGGVMSGRDIFTVAQLGASAAQICSALSIRGVGSIVNIRDELNEELIRQKMPTFASAISKVASHS